MASPDPAEPDPELVAHGRQYIWIAIGFLAATSVAVSALWVYRFGLDRAYLSWVVVRLSLLALLALLGAMLLQGRAWARWLTVALLVVGMYLAFPMFLRPGAWSRDGLFATIPLLALYIGYFVIARGLVWSTSVRAFFRAHRRRPPGGNHASSGPPPRA
jgi:membrane-bound ClpP family serine protease